MGKVVHFRINETSKERISLIKHNLLRYFVEIFVMLIYGQSICRLPVKNFCNMFEASMESCRCSLNALTAK